MRLIGDDRGERYALVLFNEVFNTNYYMQLDANQNHELEM